VTFAFAGTPVFAAEVLDDLVEQDCVPALVITGVDRGQGRGRTISSPPAAEKARQLSLPLLQTDNINQPEVVTRLREAGASLLAVAAFGQMLRAPILNVVPCLNVHASLLPSYRGAAPIARALQNGEAESGVSIMRMTPGLDDGPWALQTRVSISLYDDAGTLSRRLALLGALGLKQVMIGLQDGTVRFTEQEGEPSYAAKLDPCEVRLSRCRSALQAHNLVRALSPEIGARVTAGGLQFKVWRTWPVLSSARQGTAETGDAADVDGRQGCIVATGGRLFIGFDTGALEVLEAQPAGKKRMSAAEFLRGYGRRLGESIEEED
jgi:methionyl-tRNA formyltransferase